MAKDESARTSTVMRTVILTVILTLGIAGGLSYWAGYLGPRPQAPVGATKAPGKPGRTGHLAKERKILYWRSPMNPNEIYDRPGKSAMGMDLVPVYEDEQAAGLDIKIDPVTRQNMGIRLTRVRRGPLVHEIRTYGHVTPDETRTVRISSKTDGWIEKLYVDFKGKHVKRGEPLYELYSPALVAAQEEFLVARRSGRSGGRALLDSARRRLQYFDIAESEIRKIEQTGKVTKTLLVRSPAVGFVIDKNAEEGGFIKAGTIVFRIADLSRVWVETHIYEYELPWIAKGMPAEMRLSYVPGKVFRGRVAYVYPYLQPKTRDVVIRLEFENPALELKPDMFADVRILSRAGEGLVIPTESVIRSGLRNLVFVTRGKGKFSPRDVLLGRTLDQGRVEVLAGLMKGETIVQSGQFLLDSESKLQEAVRKMLEPGKAPAPEMEKMNEK
ncbi:MAG: efflux RND transporter periplasmic adaptor subunit [Deltaproteobacteria bacterium]|nr:efflux RND transporter periplasmic adaptor subunit [Deltaproteobacteria bacterium]MBW2101713.1 efflux RND transporter periplasmic adaptor subunit [Deltaproteobacteria bacterium]